MKAKIISDDHIEFRERTWQRYMDEVHPPYDGTLFHAGDLITACHPLALDVFRELCKRYHRVFYTAGNHDYYSSKKGGWDTLAVEGFLRTVVNEISNLQVAFTGNLFCWRERDDLISNSLRRLYAGTMWFPDSPGLRKSWRMINDPAQIRGFENEIDWADGEAADSTLVWFAWSHEVFKFGMEQCVTPGDIVMSHHLPSDRSTPKEWLDSPTQPFFVADDMEPLIEKCKPGVWIHGHTHTPCDYLLAGATRVICNPIGYPGERRGHMQSGQGLLPNEFEF